MPSILKRVRITGGWVAAPGYVYLAEPSPASLALGFTLALAGLGVRAWAASAVHKGERLTTTGPYAYTRNPLYLGSLLLVLGLIVAAAHPIVGLLLLGLYAAVYAPTIRRERTALSAQFPEEYQAYAAAVPLFLPRLRPYRAPDDPGSRPTLAGYWRYREYEASIGVALAFGVLLAKLLWVR